MTSNLRICAAATALLLVAACSQQEPQPSSVQFTDGPQQAQSQPGQLQQPSRPQLGFGNTNPAGNAPAPQTAWSQSQIRPLPSYGDPRPAQPQGTVVGLYGRPAVRPAAPMVIPPSPALTPPSNIIVQSHLSMLKPDPRCEPFRGQITAAGGAGVLDAATIARFVQILQTADASGCVKQS